MCLGKRKKKKLFVCPERNIRPSGGLLNKERAESRREGSGRPVPRVHEPARGLPHTSGQVPLQPGTPVLILPAICVCPVSSHVPPKTYSAEGRSIGFDDWALEAVTTGRWDAFSRPIPPFRRLHDPPAFVSLFRI